MSRVKHFCIDKSTNFDTLNVMMMRDRILAMEARANAARLSITKLCQEAGVGRSSWYKWKENIGAPSVLVWDEIDRVMRSHEA